MNATGEIVLYEEQDEALWNQELIDKGNYFLVQAATGKELTKYHLEAAIAYWHTFKAGTTEKWKNILQLYNQLLLIEYSPAAALNRTYALAMAHGKEQAIVEAEKLKLENNHLYHALLGTLYTGIDATKALQHFRLALTHTRSAADHAVIIKKMQSLVKKV
jgi:RNA polymerase sigma-70 factor (ECF subfamily)